MSTTEEKYNRYKHKDILELKDTYNLAGDGTELNPIIFDSVDIFSKTETIYLFKSHLHIVFKNFKVPMLKLTKCLNITIENSDFVYFIPIHCSNLAIKTTSFGSAELYSCKNITLLNCQFKFLHLSLSSFNVIKDCIIEKFSNWTSLGNVFENCRIPENLHREILEGDPISKAFSSYFSKLYLIVLPFIFIFPLMFLPFLMSASGISFIGLLIVFIFLLSFIILAFFVLLIYGKKYEKKIKDIPPNIIK
ncbi:MAG: hypothetical protein ACFFAH_03340 [Promethearchaeota archaeon]